LSSNETTRGGLALNGTRARATSLLLLLLGLVTLASAGSGSASAIDLVTPTLVQTIQTSTYAPSSPDPSGIVYVAESDRFIVADSEVDEMTLYQGFNLYSATRTGSGQGTGTTLVHGIKEPAGLGYNPADGTLYVSDDDADRVSVLRPGPDSVHGTADDAVTHLGTAAFGSLDPEGVEYDTATGHLFICDGLGIEMYRVDPVDGIFGNGDDVVSSFDLAQFGARDCEGVGIDQRRGLLLAIDPSSKQIYEVTREGALARLVDLDVIPIGNGRNFASVTLAPSSDPADDPAIMSYWVVDRQTDNEDDPSENDGLLYELAVPGEPHAGPTVVLTSPTAGTTVSGTVQVQASATAPAGVAQVEFFVGDVSIGADANGADGWSVAWNTNATPDGNRTVRATATDTGGLTASSTVTVRVSNSTTVLAADDFERTVPLGANWSGCWTRAGSPHDVYSVSDGVGRVAPTTTTTGMQVCGDVNAGDVDLRGLFTWSSAPAGATLFPAGLMARFADAANFYAAQLRVENATPGTLRVDIRRHLAGVSNALSTTTVTTGFSAGTPVWLRFQVEGTALRVKVWQAGDSEPTAWTSERTDANLTASGSVGYRYSAGAGATSAPTVTMDDFTASSLGSPEPPDLSVALTSPAAGATVSGVVPVTADAAPGGAVTSVEFLADGVSIGTDLDGSDGWSVQWNTSPIAQGTRALTAVARDAGGNEAVSTAVSVSVLNDATPPVSAIACNDTACSTGWYTSSVAVTLSATDAGSGVAAIRYTLDGSEPTAASTVFNGQFTVSATTTVRFRAWDNAGNVELTKSQVIRIDTTPPVVAMTKPANGSTVTKTVQLEAAASDVGSGVLSVTFYVDGAAVGTALAAPYRTGWNPKKHANGSHTVWAVATDVAGNVTTSSPIVLNTAAAR
jgi:Bacterial Ig domain/Chitobiase/beta-hexosaminidase C-terminal domain